MQNNGVRVIISFCTAKLRLETRSESSMEMTFDVFFAYTKDLYGGKITAKDDLTS